MPMTYDEAVNVILEHGIGRGDVPLEDATYPDGFLGCLRPYSGLNESNFLSVMEAVIALRPHVLGVTQWERRLVSGLWGLTTKARSWGLDPAGMLQRNGVLSKEESSQLLIWVTCIEMAVSRLLHEGDPADAMAYYRGEGPAG